MSEFDDFLGSSLGETQDVLGTVPFWWEGHELRGDFTKLDESYDIEEGGKQIRVTATLFAAATQFVALPRPRKGQPVKVGQDTYEIGHAESDALGVTMFLGADIRRKV